MFENTEEIIKQLEEINGTKFSDEQLSILRATGGMSIMACAGSGKTTVLVNLIAKRIKSGEIMNPDKLLCCTYSKSGAIEMTNRLGKLLPKMGINCNVQVKTLHATYYRVLRKFGLNREVCTESKRLFLLREACKENKVRLEDEDLETLSSLVSFQINNLLSDSGLVGSWAYTLDDVTEEQYRKIRQTFCKKKDENNCLDFDDMQLYMYVMLVGQSKREDVLAYCKSLWKYFYIDEFQDTSKIQFAIIRALVEDSSKLMVIGDDDQCIYQWRGADPSIILNIRGYYDVDKFMLSTNYRCRKNIVDFAATGVQNSSIREEKQMQAFKESGLIELVDTDEYDLFKMSRDTVDMILDEIKVNGISPSDICILSRNNAQVSIIGNMLLREGVFCETSGDMMISKSTIYKDMKALIEIAELTFDKFLVKGIIWKLCEYFGATGAKIIYDFMDATGCDIKTSLGYIINRYTQASVMFDKQININMVLDNKLKYRFSNVSYKSINGLVAMYNTLCNDEFRQRFKGLLDQYIVGTEFMYNGEQNQRMVSGMAKYFMYMLDNYGLSDLKSFIRLTEQYENGSAVAVGSKVTISTIHKSKGMEWDHVYIFGADNISFPSFEHIAGMVDKGIGKEDILNYINGERRLNYVAMTRARNKLTIVGDYTDMSLFVLECLGLIEHYRAEDGNNISDRNNEIILGIALERISKSVYIRKLIELAETGREGFVFKISEDNKDSEDNINDAKTYSEDSDNDFYNEEDRNDREEFRLEGYKYEEILY